MSLMQRANKVFVVTDEQKEYLRKKKNKETKLEIPQKNINIEERWEFLFLPQFSPNSLPYWWYFSSLTHSLWPHLIKKSIWELTKALSTDKAVFMIELPIAVHNPLGRIKSSLAAFTYCICKSIRHITGIKTRGRTWASHKLTTSILTPSKFPQHLETQHFHRFKLPFTQKKNNNEQVNSALTSVRNNVLATHTGWPAPLWLNELM